MSVKVLGSALAGAVCLALGVQAQTLDQVTGPSNPPPASFKGQQFVDSRGCVFVRAGFGGRVTWVPRVDGKHKPICGLGGEDVAAETSVAEAAPKAAKGGFWAALFAPRAAAPVASAAPVLAAATPAPHDLVVTISNPVRRLPKPPQGWELAWEDDRLNPMRAIGTPEGEAAQDRVFTRTVPMVARADIATRRQSAQVAEALPAPRGQSVTVATMSAPGAEAGTAPGTGAVTAAVGRMIQVGAFGQPANAEAAAARIAGLGLPVALRPARGLQVVLAGPLAPQGLAEALSALRAAGFQDAFAR